MTCQEWIATLKLRSAAIACADWEALAFEQYEMLTGDPPIEVRVANEQQSAEPAKVFVVGPDGVELAGFFSARESFALYVTAACQRCSSEVLLDTKGRPETYQHLIELRCVTFCDRCLAAENDPVASVTRRYRSGGAIR